MKQIKTLLAALFVAMAGTASAQTNYVHITKTDGTKVHFSQDEIESMTIDTNAPEPDFVTFTNGTNTVKVANMNLGATSVADGTSCYGDYYAWGATETFGIVAYTAYNAGTVTATKTGGYTEANAPAPEDFADVVTAKMGTGYHMPTQAEIQTLYEACGGTGTSMAPSSISSGDAYAQGIYWVTGATSSVTIGGDEYKVNGVLFVQDADTHVFFPAAGFVNGTNLDIAGNYGLYWSSSLFTNNTYYAYSLYFYRYSVYPVSNNGRCYGFPVRPFKD